MHFCGFERLEGDCDCDCDCVEKSAIAPDLYFIPYINLSGSDVRSFFFVFRMSPANSASQLLKQRHHAHKPWRTDQTASQGSNFLFGSKIMRDDYCTEYRLFS